MSNIEKRIEKAEAKAQEWEKEANERKAKLEEIQRLEGDDSLAALFLRKELETGRKWGFVDFIMEADGK